MKLLFKGSYIVVQPDLADKVGLNEAIILQQLFYSLKNSPHKFDGHTWYVHTYDNWLKRFKFWSYSTVKRVFQKLEKDGYIVTTTKYNPYKNIRKKWYRLNYEKLAEIEGLALYEREIESGVSCRSETSPSIGSKRINRMAQSKSANEFNMSQSIKDINKNNNKKYIKEIASKVISYFNKKANKEYLADTKQTLSLIHNRLSEGYTEEDFYKVIDFKVQEWINDSYMNQYLVPRTLFSDKHFSNYLEDARNNAKKMTKPLQPVELNFNDGEEQDWYKNI